MRRSYFDRAPIDFEWGGIPFTAYHHTFADLCMGLIHASYRLEAILEPEPRVNGPRSAQWREAFRYVPRTIIFKARKEGN